MTHINSLHIRNKEETGLCAGLYIVPTPIGNLRDITLRGLDVLTACDVIVCEDARVTGKLLKAYAIEKKKKIVYNDHADDTTKNYILSLIADGNIVAMVSDAGTPMISDPGFKLTRDAMDAGLFVTALPGANAVLPALQLSAMPTDKFIFAGFLPSKDKGVRDVLAKYHITDCPVILYESPNRIIKTLDILAEIYPNRNIAIIREISKIYEESLRGLPSEVITQIGGKTLKGEIVLILNGVPMATTDSFDIDELIQQRLKKHISIKDLSAEIAGITGAKKKDIYNRAIALQS